MAAKITLSVSRWRVSRLVHTESEDEIRVISFRGATTHEEEFLFVSIEDQLPPSQKNKGRRGKGYGLAPRAGRKADRARTRPKGLPSCNGNYLVIRDFLVWMAHRESSERLY
jgi:hypothetical protein